MLEIYASTALILAASLLLGRAILGLLGWDGAHPPAGDGAVRPPGSPAWLSGAIGFAALVVVAPFLVRLPGRGTTAAIVIGALCVLAAVSIARERRDRERGSEWLVGVAAAAIVVGLATLPFLFNERVGVLGEGIYTNDHAAQLYWADWLRDALGPEPSAVQFGYPIGPQAVAVIAAEVTGTSMVSAFNGLLLAIPALTSLAALGALGGLPPLRRIAVAAICGLPYLAASFLAQSAFKETAMALFVLAFAIALAGLPAAPKRAVAGIGLILAAASVFTFSLPGLAWFAISVPIWLALEALAGRSPVDWGAAREALSQHRLATAIGALVVIAVAVVAIGPATSFVEKVDDVQFSAGRLSSPVSWGEAFGIWPEGDFRIVRTEVAGSPLALALGALALGFGAFALLRGRRFALLAMLVTGAIVYLGARLVAEIHVEAKALAVIAPLALLVALHPLLAAPTSTEHRATTIARYAFGTLFLAAAIISTLLALRAAPVGFDDRQAGLEVLAERIEGEPVVFLGVDRFSAHHLRDTLMRAPAGYVPEEIESRPEKRWQQGDAVDFDSLEPGKLDKFRYAITTDAAYASTPPSNFEPLVRSADYVLWERRGETPRSRVVEGEDGEIGALLDCAGRLGRRDGTATVIDGTERVSFTDWQLPGRVEDAAAGQERAFAAPGDASVQIHLSKARPYELSLQYHSQVPLKVLVDGDPVAELPPSLDGMYLDGAGRGAFWPAGTVDRDQPGLIEVVVRAAEPSGLQRAVGVERRVWLGDIAATPSTRPVVDVVLARACVQYVDHFTLDRRGENR
ncbi:MAG: hypothetical protein K0R88_1874 [Solirubrobacterales bacterium]|nr:hypothetical protein [Solirubrobacterales bacterium]